MAHTVLLERSEKVLKRSFVMMGKSQKFSNGVSSSFVLDYCHVAETMGESEGLGSSGRMDSEESCAPKRKCISLNKDMGDCFNVPLQVISFAKMSGSERKELEFRLRAALERIQVLHKKFLSRNAAAVSSSSNGHGKKLGSNRPRLKHGSSGRVEPTKQRPPYQLARGNAYAAIMKQCESILNKLRTNQFGWVFNNPVDVVALNIPDYYTVIKHPMDLGTIKNKISSGAYSNPLGFVADVRLTFTNAMTYNPPGNDVHVMAEKLSKFFESKWKHIEKKLVATAFCDRREADAIEPVLQPKKRKASPVMCKTVSEKVMPRVTAEERQHLSNRLQSMLEDMPDQIVEFFRRHVSNANEPGEEEIEVDIDVLGDDILLELKRLLDGCLPEKQIGHHSKAEHSEIEILNESGLSNSSLHHCKVTQLVDEDVDIGGNDPPISSHPLVEIEKDQTHRGSKCSSSSSSSSDSGSSSSGSDSGSSSSDSEGRGSTHAKTATDNKRLETAHDQDRSDSMNQFDINRTTNGLNLLDQDAHHPNTISSGTDRHQDGENDKQVSPDKLYRAALLRIRFADTILKAHEKTRDQGEQVDPEQLRREREELERKQREEKARLQEEAKVAEVARKCAEAEAAAEAKRKREFEREAARQALLKIEKTVEINENSLILKDLEMLGTVPGEHAPSSVDETSPGHSQDSIGGFKLGGSNPLEQLGLYMKVDEEDEEDVEPKTAPTTGNAVEGGEID